MMSVFGDGTKKQAVYDALDKVYVDSGLSVLAFTKLVLDVLPTLIDNLHFEEQEGIKPIYGGE